MAGAGDLARIRAGGRRRAVAGERRVSPPRLPRVRPGRRRGSLRALPDPRTQATVDPA